jgi:hypothetical protein
LAAVEDGDSASSPESSNIQLNWELANEDRGDLTLFVNPDPANPDPVLPRELGGDPFLEADEDDDDKDSVVESPRRSSKENGLGAGGGGTGAGRYVSAILVTGKAVGGGVDPLLAMPAALNR